MGKHAWRVNFPRQTAKILVTPGWLDAAKNTWFVIQFWLVPADTKAITVNRYRHLTGVHTLCCNERELRFVQQVIGQDGRTDIRHKTTHSEEQPWLVNNSLLCAPGVVNTIKQETIDYVKFLWNNYVVGMDSMRQEESIYEPVMTAMAETTKSLTDVDHWEIVWARLKAKLTPLRTLSAVLLVAGVAGLVVWIWPKICARLPSRRSTNDARGAPTARRPRPPVEEFYRRLEGVLARVSLTRTADQTQREFALAAGGELAELPHTRGAAPLPRRIVDHYYRVRFGNRPLNDSQRADVEHALDELAAALPLTPGKSSPGKQTNGKR